MENAIFFDVDGVLFDVSRSYRKSIIDTVHFYLSLLLGRKNTKKSIVSYEDIDLFKYFGGFNDDWDLTTGLLLYLIDLVSHPNIKVYQGANRIGAIESYLTNAQKYFDINDSDKIIKNKRTQKFLDSLKGKVTGLDAVLKGVKNETKKLVFYKGDIFTGNLVRRIFQEYYLGQKEFNRIYREKACFVKVKGSSKSEKLLFSRKVLSKLHSDNILGIVTGRCHDELAPALLRNKINRYFDITITIDDVWAEERRVLQKKRQHVCLGKPAPYSLLLGASKVKEKIKNIFYIGDQPDDILCAINARKTGANIIPVGCAFGASQKHIAKLKGSWGKTYNQKRYGFSANS